MDITEKDLFMYVWAPAKLNYEKFSYLNKNRIKFKAKIELLNFCYQECYKEIDERIINSILKKVFNKEVN